VVATSASLTKAECTKLAQVAQDGLARAANPSHLLVDGDTVFALATGTGPTSTPPPADGAPTSLAGAGTRAAMLNQILAAGAEVFAAACLDALLNARGAGSFPSYRDVCPSAFTTG
jgi:L-aminopeptidase/D-esterase-like protein